MWVTLFLTIRTDISHAGLSQNLMSTGLKDQRPDLGLKL